LGAFTWHNEDRIGLFLERIRKTGRFWMALHFLLLSFCLAFPVIFTMARLSPFELYGRLYGESFMEKLPENEINDFNKVMLEGGYGRDVLLPFLCMAFGMLIVIQTTFYLFAVFFLGVSRMNLSFLSFGDRLGLALYSSTLPAPIASIFGFFLPAVHILIFYFMVIFFIFQRSNRLR
jgi:hypothetical protein